MASVKATRSVLHALIKASPHKFKDVAEHVGERPDTFSTRLTTRRDSYHLDIGLVLAVLDLIGVPFSEYARLVEEASGGNGANIGPTPQQLALDSAVKRIDRAVKAYEEARRG